ncbi:MAG: hydantoinase/oxoprolinase family protein [Planctomycetaceae bacterium]|nr:hydantoinase/oxoprolinase family protein [Planctomycetaceae bacterium]
MNVLGLDIGGANIKAATTSGETAALAFTLWRHPELLADRISDIHRRWPECDRVALTMTGELADCYPTKSAGVSQIVGAVLQAVPQLPVAVWTTGGAFVSPIDARRSPLAAAAANWHALTTWVARQFPNARGILIDIGSTTADIIPFRHGEPTAMGLTDFGRLQHGELVYTGVRRTPLCALAGSVPVHGTPTPVAAELFATTLDVYLWLELIPEDPGDCDTANGKPATREAALDRLVRMVCCDRDELTPLDVDRLAQFWRRVQREQVQTALQQVLARLALPIDLVVLSGSGEFLAREVVDSVSELSMAERISISEVWSPEVAAAACASAVANLLAQH